MTEPAAASNFIRARITHDLAKSPEQARGWAGHPAVAAVHREAAADPAAIRTRFPPEPNGHLHIGHAKSICLNFGVAAEFGGRCHLRFDDTNPTKEDQRFVDGILDVVRWLGFDWQHGGESNLYFASDYFEQLYQCAQALIRDQLAYVDSQDAETMRANRGTLTQAGTNSPFRDRSVEENLQLLEQMRDGKHAEGSHVLRARINMASPNINMRDPVLYRILNAPHHRTGDRWHIYPMYDFAHPLEDALERITHSLCTLEFQDHRPFYEWVISNVAKAGFFDPPLPRQIEFARLNLEYTVMSKRKLQTLVVDAHVNGWDDPRLPTLAGLRRRGYTPESIRLFSERIGVAKADSWIDYGVLEQALRDDLDARAPRAVAVLNPLRLELTNLADDSVEYCEAPVLPRQPEHGVRRIPLTRELWIEREDFAAEPPKGFFRLFPGNRVRLRYGFVIECTGYETDANGQVSKVTAVVLPDSKSGTPGADNYKVKGTLHWLPASPGHEAMKAEIRLYDRLFTQAQPDAGGADYLDSLNPNSSKIISAYVESGATSRDTTLPMQFERHGYFVADAVDHSSETPVFNRTVTLKDSWAKQKNKHKKS
ncbi:MAG: glutamine--tRNA ligase/YqeY domain fusion protein [Burkholderiaceae bacterium]